MNQTQFSKKWFNYLHLKFILQNKLLRVQQAFHLISSYKCFSWNAMWAIISDILRMFQDQIVLCVLFFHELT